MHYTQCTIKRHYISALFSYYSILYKCIICGIIISTKEQKKQTTGTARTTQANEDIRKTD
nr:MAG TPA: hypothetical protein [Caudoviricetes sp.]DAH09292.1 MAG TPA: hypothetical protein [Caudoviricetes sp.]